MTYAEIPPGHMFTHGWSNLVRRKVSETGYNVVRKDMLNDCIPGCSELPVDWLEKKAGTFRDAGPPPYQVPELPAMEDW